MFRTRPSSIYIFASGLREVARDGGRCNRAPSIANLSWNRVVASYERDSCELKRNDRLKYRTCLSSLLSRSIYSGWIDIQGGGAKISDGCRGPLRGFASNGKNDRTECRCSPLRANLKYGYVCPPFVTEARYSINVRDINTEKFEARERSPSEKKTR